MTKFLEKKHAAMEGELGRTAKQTQHCRCLWEGGVKPNGGVDFGEGCAVECGIQLNGAVDFWAKTL